jgi:hypothetical protein
MPTRRDSTRDRAAVLLVILVVFSLFEILGVPLFELGVLLLRVGLVELTGWLLG